MQISQIVSELQLEIVAGHGRLNREISGGYVSDLLSNVMGRSCAGTVWVTMQAHQNVVAVAALLDLAAVIIAGGVTPDHQTVTKAQFENIVILTTTLSAYEVAGRLYGMGIKSS
ncbi:MAG: serine kinase [Veillonellaceae bacterium]|nr:serine kinase [Veillonellaceae bacterium]